MKIKLRPYQEKTISDVKRSWCEGNKNVMMVSPCGSGKSPMIASIVSDEPGASVSIAHRQELLSQLSIAYARNGIRHKIIGSNHKLIRSISSLHMFELGNSYYDANSKYSIGGVDTLLKMGADHEYWRQVKLMVIDECFLAGTIIEGIPIEDIKIGDYVTCYDEKNKSFTKSKVVNLFKNKSPDHIVRVRIKPNHILYCTSGHPFFTKRGWVNASEIKIDDEVLYDKMYSMRKRYSSIRRDSTLSNEKNRKSFLQQRLWFKISRDKSKRKKEKNSPNNTMFYMSKVLRSIKTSVLSVFKNWQSVLQHSMLKRLSFSNKQFNDENNEHEIRFKIYDEKQQIFIKRIYRKNETNSNTYWAQTYNKGWKRATANFNRKNMYIFIDRIRFFISIRYKNWNEKRFGLPFMLQTRFFEHFNKISNRNRWWQPLWKKIFRREERPVFKWVGVESIKILKHSDINRNNLSDEGNYVYNIEVEEFHNYVANGILVHNCQHVLKGNKWGKVASYFPNARKLLPTATPCRADGKGLGAHADGIADDMVIGTTMRELINAGYLTDYRIYCSPNNLHRQSINISQTTGDMNVDSARQEVKRAQITGDIVQTYLKYAKNKLGVTFTVDVETAGELTKAYRQAGVSAEVVTAKTPDFLRLQILKDFKNRKILQLVNVDLFGEGFDLPALEVVSFGRPTASYSLYHQQFNRVSRLLIPEEFKNNWDAYSNDDRKYIIANSDKPFGIILDHVGNVEAHGLPDKYKEWSLDRRESKKSNVVNKIPLRSCLKCTLSFEKFLSSCPYCLTAIPEPKSSSRSSIEEIEGNLIALDPFILARMRDEIEAPMKTPYNATPEIVGRLRKLFYEKQTIREKLKNSIAWWAGYQYSNGYSESESYRKFYYSYGVDVASCQLLSSKEMQEITEKINKELLKCGINACFSTGAGTL